MNEHDIQQQLAQHIGTTQYYRHALNPQLLLTDGVHHLRELAKACWLIDDIAAYLPMIIARHPDDFYVIRLVVSEDSHGQRSANLVFEDGQGSARKVWYSVLIAYTDFPLLGTTTLYLARSAKGYVMMLPSEY